MSQLRIQCGLKHCWNRGAAICTHLKRSHWDQHRGATTQRSENTKKEKKKTHRAQSITAFWLHDQHLSFTVNVAWNTWAGTRGAISAGGQAGGGGGAVERCCWQACWKSDDKYSQSDSYFGFCQFGGAEQRLSSLVHCVLMRTCLPDPSFHLSCDHSILLLRDVSQRLRQNNPITISTQFFLWFFFFFPPSNRWKCKLDWCTTSTNPVERPGCASIIRNEL